MTERDAVDEVERWMVEGAYGLPSGLEVPEGLTGAKAAAWVMAGAVQAILVASPGDERRGGLLPVGATDDLLQVASIMARKLTDDLYEAAYPL